MAFFNCVARLNKAAGRKLSDAELTKIFEDINRAKNDIVAKRGTPPPGRTGIQGVMDAAAQEAAAQRIAEIDRDHRNKALQVVRLSTSWDNAKEGIKAGLPPLDAVSRLMVNRADGRMNVQSIENRVIALRSIMRAHLQDTFKALGDDFLGFIQDNEKIRLLVREMRGEATGDALAKKGGDAWRKATEEFRQAFNEAGGQIGKLDNWFPQHHSQELVAKAGKQAWVDAVFPALDRSKYADDAGTPFSDTRMKEFLSHAYDSIATDGYNKITPGKFEGVGAAANRHAEHRQIHFANADAWMNYWQAFGADRTFVDVINGHADTIARDLAVIEKFGPNPELAYRTLRDMAAKKMATDDPSSLVKVKTLAAMTDRQWAEVSGAVNNSINPSIAKAYQSIRNLNVAGKLGSAFWSSAIGDRPMFEMVSMLNNLPALERWGHQLRMLNPANSDFRQTLRTQGLMLENMTAGMSKFGEDLGGSLLTGKLANAVMRISGMNAINEWSRGAFGLNMMEAFGRMTRTMEFDQATKTDMHILKAFGVSKAHWDVWRLADTQDVGKGVQALTPDSIANIPDAKITAKFGSSANPQELRREATISLLGSVNSESRNAIIEPGARERAQIAKWYAGERGTHPGELSRAFWQFKTFPLSQFEKMWDLAMSRPNSAGKAGVVTAVMGMQVVAGAMMVQISELLGGRDPRAMDTWKFGVAAFMKGGAIGLYGDFLYGVNQSRIGSGLLEAFAGPTIGSGIDIIQSTLNEAGRAVEGKDTHLLAKYLQIGKGFIPGNNLWYTKAATDHILFQNLQENLSPGYLEAMRARMRKNYGQESWWEPGDMAPYRAPDLSAIGGR
jgi:hypothetical protein